MEVHNQSKNVYEYRVRFDVWEEEDGRHPDYPQYENFTVEAMDSAEAFEILEHICEGEIERFHPEDTEWEAKLIDVH